MATLHAWNTRVIDISTLKGLRQAERLKAQGYNRLPSGYKFTMCGIDKLMFWIPNPKAVKVMSPDNQIKVYGAELKRTK